MIPWYGKDLTGGAEIQCQRTAENILQRDVKVEVFTTCSKKFLSDWTNYFSECEEDINGVRVRRFSVDERNTTLFDSLNYKHMNKIPLSYEEEKAFIENSINSKKMYKVIKEQEENRIYIFIPYLYGTTYFGCQICPSRSLMIPCLHDEGYAYMKIFKEAFPKIKGMIFNSESERDLAVSIYGNLPTNIAPGEGVDSNFKPNSEDFKKKYKVDKFLLYAGRKDATKNVPLLLEYYSRYIEKNGPKFDLVLTGPGKIDLPSKNQEHIKNLMLPKDELYNAYSAALVTCQPSLNESFSLSIMESWLSHTPVLVNGNCDVTKNHCDQCDGGLYFTNYPEFEACMNFFIQNKKEAEIMAKNGKKYVLDNFSWDIILDKYLKFINKLIDN